MNKGYEKIREDVKHILDEDAVYDDKKKRLEDLLAAAEAEDRDLTKETEQSNNDILENPEGNNFELIDKQENESKEEKSEEDNQEEKPVENESSESDFENPDEFFNKDNDDDEENSPNGAVCMTVPLFLRLLEYAKEDAETDLDLHYAAENVLRLAADPGILGMDDYAEIIDIYDEDEDDDEGEIENDEHVDEAKKKKKKKYKKSQSNYLGRWGRYFPRIPWIVPCGFLPPGPKPPEPPKPDTDGGVEEVTPPADSGDIVGGGEVSAPVDGGSAGPVAVGESKVLDELNNIDEEALKKFIVSEYGSKFSNSKDVADGKDKQAAAVELVQIASLSDISKLDTSSGENSCMLFVKFKAGETVWAATAIFNATEHKFTKPEFLNPEYEIFQVDDKAEGAAAVFFKAFPELYEIKTF